MNISHLLRQIALVLMIGALSGCGNYHHYGLEVGSSDSTLTQKDPFYITGDYEFKSVVYRSDDGNFTISIQHPLHPLPEPEVFISQIEFSLNESDAAPYIIKDISFWHKAGGANKVEPYEIKDLSKQGFVETTFYVHKYKREDLTSELIEHVAVEFSYKEKNYKIYFEENVNLVRRWNKLAVLITN